MIKVSICIPAYEQPLNLDECLNSIGCQSFKDFEVIITDDSKSDDLMPIIDKYNDKFIIKYYKNSTLKGSPDNWNESVRHATGKYIKILHHDDYFKDNDSLEKFVCLLDNNPESKVAFCSSYHVDNKHNYLSSHILSDTKMKLILEDPKYLFFGNVIGAPSMMMYHRDLNIIFDNRMKWLVDIDFYIQILKNNQFTYSKDELICINIGEEERITYQCENNKKINIYESMIMFEKFNMNKLSFQYKYHFLKLFSKYNINNLTDIYMCGYTGNITKELSNLFKYVKIFSVFYHINKKVKSAF